MSALATTFWRSFVANKSVAAPRRHPSLAEIKSRTLKPVDAWWTVFVIDPVTIRLLWLQVRVLPRVTPGQVTFASLLAGLAAAASFYTGHLIWGALLYQLSFAFDCTDGKLARLKDLVTPLGEFWDGFVGLVVYVICIVGLMFNPAADGAMLPLGLALLALRAMHMYTNPYVHRPNVLTWSHFVAKEGSWLERHRLLLPGSFPDKHAVMFLLGPITGYVLAGFAVNLVLEVFLLFAKVAKLVREKRGPGAGYETPPQ